MNFNYINDLKYKDELEELYLSAFPKEERFSFWILEDCSKEDNSDLYAILDNDKFVGMCYIVNCDGAYYLMYLAVQDELRNKKYVSKILEDLKKSRESLNNTPYYCFPFYEYNNRAVELVEKAGFRMAFIGGSKKVYPGDNLYKIHRYELDNTTTIQEFSDMIN